jgi:hypothetical protein
MRHGGLFGLGQSCMQFFSQFGQGPVAKKIDAIWADLVAIWVAEELRKLSHFDFSRAGP